MALMSLLIHPDVPAIFLAVPNILQSICGLLACTNDVIRCVL